MVSTLSFQTGVLSGADGDVIWCSEKSWTVMITNEQFAFRWRIRSAGALGSQVGGLDLKTPVYPFTAAESLSDVKQPVSLRIKVIG